MDGWWVCGCFLMSVFILVKWFDFVRFLFGLVMVGEIGRMKFLC